MSRHFTLLSFLLAAAVLAPAQGRQPLTPATDTPGMAIPDMMILRTPDYPSRVGFAPAHVLRTNAGERWFQIEKSRGDYSCAGKCGTDFGNLFTAETGWVPTFLANGTQPLYTFNTVPNWATASGKTNEAPTDIDQPNEVCQAPLAGQTRPHGNCIWAEWVTKLMQRSCGVNAQPKSPLVGKCQIHYFEGWNEFNVDGFWTDSLAHLAKMDVDAELIIKSYCGDCYFLAGSTSAGGTGYHGNPAAGSGQWDQSLGQYLDAWHAYNPQVKPDGLSFHAYPSHENVNPIPFPETMVSAGDAQCTPSNTPNKACTHAVVRMPTIAQGLVHGRSWLDARMPVWNTESGYPNRSMFHGTVSDPASGQEIADPTTDLMRQAYVSRLMILMANSGVAVNLWYQQDNQCYGTLYGQGKPVGAMNCKGREPFIPQGITPAGKAWNVTYKWLHGGAFTGPCSPSGDVWSCPVRRENGTPGQLVWYTRHLQTTQFRTSYKHAADLDDKSASVTGTATISNRPILLY